MPYINANVDFGMSCQQLTATVDGRILFQKNNLQRPKAKQTGSNQNDLYIQLTLTLHNRT